MIDLTNFIPNEKSAFNETVGDINKRIQTNHVTTQNEADLSSDKSDHAKAFQIGIEEGDGNHLLIYDDKV